MSAPSVVRALEGARSQHAAQGGVDARETTLQIQREHADGDGIVSVLELSLGFLFLFLVQAHLLGQGKGRQQAGSQDSDDAVERTARFLQAEGGRHDLIQTGEEGHGHRPGVPERDA